MGKRHNLLTDEIFKNSKYIDAINRVYEIKDFRKEYSNQYKPILNIFQVFINLYNCFNSDSNLSKSDKVKNAKIILKELFKINKNGMEENVIGNKYSVRIIKDICEKRCRHIYNCMMEWYLGLYYLDKKDIENSNQLKIIIEEINEEMYQLEEVGFDNVVVENIEYQKNGIKNYKDYVKYISKFDIKYGKRNEFIEQYKKDFYDYEGINLTDDDIKYLEMLYCLISFANNGLINIINDFKIDNHNLNERSSTKYLYKAYLKTLNLSYNKDTFDDDVKVFALLFNNIYYKMSLKGNFTTYEVLNSFDIFSFITIVEESILSDDFVNRFSFSSRTIDKIILDLKCIYEKIMEIKTIPDDIEKQKENCYIAAYNLVVAIIDRNKNIFERVS